MLPTDLFRAKLYIPTPRTDLVVRPRLTARLAEGMNRPFTLICAPAGYGKTTLLSHRLSQRRLPTAWLSLDSQDNDPIRFWSYVMAALQTIQPDLGQAALDGLQVLHLPLMAVLPGLLDEIDQCPTPLVLVLDDYQFITEPTIHETLAFCLDHLPRPLHLVMATRADPPLPLARLRVRHQLVEFRAADLRFTADETAAFLNGMLGLILSAADVAALEARTEGWIAGLQLAALSMQGRRDLTGFIRAFTGSHVFIAEYLVEEVLQHQPPDVQTFLLHTSILERLNASLCEAVTGHPDGQAVLMALHRANLFVIPLDDEAEWFRYHHLFADLLRAYLRHRASPDVITALHRRAASWYTQHGFVHEAVDHALLARDFENAAQIVEQHVYPMMAHGEMATLLRWFEALPGDVARQHPLLYVGIAWVLTMAGAMERVEALLQQVETPDADDSLLARTVSGNAAAMRAFFAMLAADDARSLELANRAEVLLPEANVQVRGLLLYILGSAYRNQGQYDEAAAAFRRQVQLGETAGDLMSWVTGLTEVVNRLHAKGRLREACETGQLALQRLAERNAARFGSFAKLEVALCDVLREQNELDEAYRRLTEVLARMQGWDMPTDQLFAYLVLVRVQQARGAFDGAFESLRAARGRKASPVLPFLAHAVDMHEIQLLLAAHQMDAAARLIDGLQPDMRRTAPAREQEGIMRARVHLARGQPDEAAAVLAPLASEVEAAGELGTLLDMLTVQVCILNTQGNREAAAALLMKTLALAEPEGFVQVFVDKGEAMQLLLTSAARQLASTTDPALTSLRTYIARLLDAFPTGALPGAIRRLPDAAPVLLEALTPRELEVLQLIAAGDSNQTIADKLSITVNGVKKHTGNIFGKLNVGSRTQAVARAHQLGLLSTDEPFQ